MSDQPGRQPGTDVRFTQGDCDVTAACPCGWHARGDSAAGAFGAWWQHRAARHWQDPA